MSKATLREINAHVRKTVPTAALVKGRGYFYFINVEAPSIYVNSLGQMSRERWLRAVDAALNERVGQ